MNTDKLFRLIDQHRARQTSYQHLAARYRSAVNELAGVMANLVSEMPVDEHDPINALIRQSTKELAELKESDLNPLGLNLGQIRRLIAARRQVARLEGEANDQAAIVKDSLALAERLVAYARSRGEMVSLGGYDAN